MRAGRHQQTSVADARVAPVDDDDDDLHDTGHSLHFLARLERIDGPQTDLALRLYRDSALVRAIAADPTAAAQALAPEQRVAIALAAGAEPPLVIVTAGGAFVTCLAAGMAPSGARVVPWERVCIHVGRADREAARTAEAEAVLAAHGGSSMLRRLLESGALVSREGMQQMMAVEPLLGPTYTRALYEMLPLLPGLADRASRCRAGRRGDERTLRRWFDGYYALSHLLILSAASGYDQFSFLEERTEQQRYDLVGIYLSFVDLGHAPLCNAALWAIARAGKVFLPALQRALAEAEDVHSWLAAAFGLQAVAFAHERLRSEAARSFGGQGLPAWMASDERLRAAAREMRQITERRPTPEETAELRRQSAEWMHASLETIDPDDRIGARRAWSEGDRAPVEAIYTAYLTHLPGTMMQTEVFTQRLAALPVLVRAEPEDLCWPAAVLPHFGRRYDAAHARLLAAPWAIPAPEPVRAIPKPGRNDSCSCGSAKKYKRCCGAA